ncbi:hypothetical protein I3J09_14980 [Streptomyces clavuligerus]|uniref:RVT_1 domain-containing protein n=1 Tax=Streptomyces clavuligerus TaxID=1901 RepID=B5GY57_STRCL|nr:hypothetical protein [Streptomyces clavuligerus]ANW19397.1 hypothetical protein BB341_14805 [Streptomyces clavuligerus]AXU14005.1 hypothetical protein D1794_15450 [Streptomyces clavuligerus]EDY51264.1 hypothetical protein SSCG_04244 [Streptomyces clavuligerus]EFG07815.1 RVT_1 domain-containing protein [Streptomyces clavuligerus]MBY6303979.1 hypothetical protein [Streptomyces clavuligerus]
MGDEVLLVDRALRESFGQDLLTELIPDALGAVDALPYLRPTAEPPPLEVGWITVPPACRAEPAPVVGPDVRAHLHALAERALAGYRPRPEVFGYRSATWEYRHGYRARQERLRALGECRDELPYVLTLDVHRFFRSLPLDVLLRAAWMTGALAERLTALHTRSGRCLLPGHRWASRLGTAVLDPVDAVLAERAPGRWVRWGDDWHVCVSGADEAQEVRAAMTAALAGLGLRPATGKTGVGPVDTLLTGVARDVAGPAERVWRQGLATDDLRSLRYALPRLAPGAEVSRSLPGVVRARPELLPRAVRYLDRAVGTREGLAAAHELLEGAGEGDPGQLFAAVGLFAAGRLLALAGRHRAVADAVPDAVLAAAASSGIPALTALAVRAGAVGGRPGGLPEPPVRMLRWLERGADVRDSPPSVDTLL